MNRVLIGSLVAAVILAASPAFAHARLEKAEPAAGSMPAAPVARIDLYYSEALEPSFTKATLSDGAGRSIAATSSVDAKDGRHLVLVPKQPLMDGSFNVQWRAVSVDTHKTQGSFTFMVMP